MRIRNIPRYASRFVEPTRVFIALFISVVIWLSPVLTQPPLNNTEKFRKPLQEAGGISLVSAIQLKAASCHRSCQIEVCVNWKKGPSPACPNPGPMGGCCLEYETECDPDCEDPTPVYLPPTISAALSCANSGNNGWCIGDHTVTLTASDPQGQSLWITGTVGSQTFDCSSGVSSCSRAIDSEGSGAITYRVASATGLSANGSAAYKLDYSIPYFGGSVSGVSGTNNWYKSNATFNVTAGDSASGIASFTARIDGGSAIAVSGPIILTDGIHSVALAATDYAGFSAAATQIIQVDTITPTLNTSISGTSGSNGWYVSNVTVTPTASDAGSGLYALEVNKDGGGYVPYTAPVLFTDGIHTWQFRATDYAGNITETIQQTIKVDATTPSLSTATSGTSGSNGWYVSNVTVTPSVSDAGSGLSAFVVSTDGGAYSAYLNPIFFTEGVHTVRFRATDFAGNVTETAQQTVSVDTTTPAISLAITGTLGTNGWYRSNVTVNANVSDATSAIGLVEASADGGAWAALSQVSFSDGPHSYQFKVTDNAGNNTTIPLQNLKIDTIAPAIDMTAELSLGETVYYDLQDNGSGLSIYRAVIEDEDERYKKVVWLDTLGGNKLRDQIRWDGKFADGAQAGWGQYFITLKISDAAGNETMRSAVVTVNPFSFLQEIPAFTPPLTTALPASQPQADSAPAATFGGENNNTSGGETVTTNEGGQSNQTSDGTTTTSSTTGNIPNPFANVTTLSGDGSTADTGGKTLPGNLLGTMGMVAAGAIAYETYRRREEDEQQVLNSEVVRSNVSSGGILASPVRFHLPQILINEDKDNGPSISNRPPVNGANQSFDKDRFDHAMQITGFFAEKIAEEELNRLEAVTHPHKNVDLRIYNNKPDLESNLAKLEERITRSNSEAAQKVEKAVVQAPKGKGASPLDEFQIYTKSLAEKIDAAKQFGKNLLSGKIDDFSLSMPKMPKNLNQALDVMGGYDGAGDTMSVAGSLAYLATGNQTFDRVSDAGQILGINGGVANLVKYGNAALEFVSGTAPKVAQGATWLGKASGVLSGLFGIYSMYDGYNTLTKAQAQNNTQMQWVGGLNILSGALATAGGIALFIPGGQPVAAVLLGGSAIASGASMVVENWTAIRTAAKQSASIISYYAGEGATRAGDLISTATKTAGNAIGNAVTALGNSISNATRTAGNAVGNALTALGDGISNATCTAGNAVGNVLAATGNFISNTTRAVTNAVGNTVANTFNAVGNTIKQIGNTSSNPTVRSVTTTVANAVSTAGNAVASVVKNVGNAYANMQQATGEAVGNVVKTVSNAVANTQKATGQAVGNVVKTVSNAVANTQKATSQVVASGLKKLAGWFAKP